MKKKLLCAICLVIVLSLVACSGKEQTPGASFQPPIEGIQWGMTPEEVMDTMALSEESILYQDESSAAIQCENIEVFGQKANVEMSFDVRYQVGLLGMRIIFEDLSKETLLEGLNESYGAYCAVNDAGEPCRWESETVAELSEEIQERYRYVQIEMPAQNSQPDDFSQEAQWDVLKSQALVTVTLGSNTLNYDAGHMAAYVNLYQDENVYEAFLRLIE